MTELIWETVQDKVDWNELSELYRIAPLGEKPAEKLKVAFGNSKFKYFVFDKERLIGVGRALADGVDCSYICDVAVHPKYQGRNLGRTIIEKLLGDSKGHKKIILYANLGKEGFYNKLGFHRMNTAMAIFEDHARALNLVLIRET